MSRNQMSVRGRILTILAGIALFAVLLFPMWQIQLAAPQYPEGLILKIYPNKLGGNVDIINGLNHYIGMKTLHTEDFVEFRVLPFIIGFFGLAVLVAGITASRKWLNAVFILFVCFGIVAMIDFWKWEYNYGHNLNPDAAIVVPGMAYQPPLIGFKQLLNFGAYSIPDTGGWIFVGVGLLLLFVVFNEWKWQKKRRQPVPAAMAQLLLLAFFLNGCSPRPEPLRVGKDACDFCKMDISDNRFGAELITRKGKIYKFDDIHCLLSFLQSDSAGRGNVGAIYLTDFSGDHSLMPSGIALLLKSEKLLAPMGGHVAAFSNADSLALAARNFNGSTMHWDELYKP